MIKDDKELAAYLAGIRKTIADSKNMLSQVELRMAETDRLLESQGLTREQVNLAKPQPEGSQPSTRLTSALDG